MVVCVDKIELKAQGRPNLANGISLYVTDDPQGRDLEFGRLLVRARKAAGLK
jgi:hypothetical protein|tara:strand:+ start:306 stop:461 length:156 start_codon:yes stop_codon:yes gene_type:complete